MTLFIRVFFFFYLFSFIAPATLVGQHYIFIEADGQQPFYVKKADTLYSSSATGFLIIPKVPKGDFTLVVGFPKAIYPEVSFDIRALSSDRGFHLKLFEGKTWGLFDRTSMEVIQSNVGLAESSSRDTMKKNSSPFAALLSDATGDEVLLDQKPVAVKKEVTNKVAVEQKKEEQSAGLPQKAELRELVKVEDLETDKEKIITFIDRVKGGQADTVNVKIEKSFQTDIIPVQKPVAATSTALQVEVNLPPQQNIPVSTPVDTVKPSVSEPERTRKLPDCTRPAAEPKDMLNLQKKLLGMPIEEDQLAYIEKIFGVKCFTSKQAVEISSFFLDEHSRMKLFKSVYWMVRDHDEFKQAGTLFFKDENIKAFRELQSGN